MSRNSRISRAKNVKVKITAAQNIPTELENLFREAGIRLTIWCVKRIVNRLNARGLWVKAADREFGLRSTAIINAPPYFLGRGKNTMI